MAKKTKTGLLSKLTMTFFDRPRLTAVIWIAVVLFGVLSYTKLLKREGFPSVNIPLAIVTGTYSADSPEAVDANIAAPISAIALKQGDVETVQAESAGNFFQITIQYKDGVDAKAATKTLESAVNSSGKLPSSAKVQYNVPYFGATGGDIQPVDLAVSFYKLSGDASTQELTDKAQEAATWINQQHLSNVKNAFIKSPFETVHQPCHR
jgi:multidrug efflux pump subunit AcrB